MSAASLVFQACLNVLSLGHNMPLLLLNVIKAESQQVHTAYSKDLQNENICFDRFSTGSNKSNVTPFQCPDPIFLLPQMITDLHLKIGNLWTSSSTVCTEGNLDIFVFEQASKL